MVLALGVPATGTVDRGGPVSGGLAGFKPHSEGDDEARILYESQLVQVGWESKDAAYGHLGDHLGGTQPAYIRQYVAALAWARAPEPERPLPVPVVAAPASLEGASTTVAAAGN
jgi:hypothetical protein